ncbi:hypothetical protein [Aeromonas hydrophila]|uniref:hypothetical protein n=1 Tax=Aeromonas hydrophila TaxID=644 RepID=UPI00235E799E|nr:hypothetical protein [Aeromonas hydrophila]
MSIFDLNVSDIFNAIGGGSPLSIINGVLHPQYVIRKHDSATVALNFDGMASIAPEGRAVIVTAPVEEGKYSSINKVKQPNRVRCAVVLSGLSGFTGTIPNIFNLPSSGVAQSSTLDAIKSMLEKADTYDIETPKETLESYDLVGHYYEVSSQRGVTLLTVYLEFQEVITKAQVVLAGAQSGAKPTSDAVSSSTTGAGGQVKQGAASDSTLDSLSKSNAELRGVVQIPTKGAEPMFQTSLETVLKSASDVATSASQKTAAIVKEISGAIT